jgi:hypothetical protein
MSERPRPRTILVTGVVLTIVGAVLQLVLPALGYSIANASESALGMDQDILLAFDFAVRAIGLIVTPLGTALIGAGIVMAHGDRIAAARPAHAHPSGDHDETAHGAAELL